MFESYVITFLELYSLFKFPYHLRDFKHTRNLRVYLKFHNFEKKNFNFVSSSLKFNLDAPIHNFFSSFVTQRHFRRINYRCYYNIYLYMSTYNMYSKSIQYFSDFFPSTKYQYLNFLNYGLFDKYVDNVKDIHIATHFLRRYFSNFWKNISFGISCYDSRFFNIKVFGHNFKFLPEFFGFWFFSINISSANYLLIDKIFEKKFIKFFLFSEFNNYKKKFYNSLKLNFNELLAISERLFDFSLLCINENLNNFISLKLFLKFIYLLDNNFIIKNYLFEIFGKLSFSFSNITKFELFNFYILKYYVIIYKLFTTYYNIFPVKNIMFKLVNFNILEEVHYGFIKKLKFNIYGTKRKKFFFSKLYGWRYVKYWSHIKVFCSRYGWNNIFYYNNLQNLYRLKNYYFLIKNNNFLKKNKKGKYTFIFSFLSSFLKNSLLYYVKLLKKNYFSENFNNKKFSKIFRKILLFFIKKKKNNFLLKILKFFNKKKKKISIFFFRNMIKNIFNFSNISSYESKLVSNFLKIDDSRKLIMHKDRKNFVCTSINKIKNYKFPLKLPRSIAYRRYVLTSLLIKILLTNNVLLLHMFRVLFLNLRRSWHKRFRFLYKNIIAHLRAINSAKTAPRLKKIAELKSIKDIFCDLELQFNKATQLYVSQDKKKGKKVNDVNFLQELTSKLNISEEDALDNNFYEGLVYNYMFSDKLKYNSKMKFFCSIKLANACKTTLPIGKQLLSLLLKTNSNLLKRNIYPYTLGQNLYLNDFRYLTCFLGNSHYKFPKKISKIFFFKKV